MTSKSLDRYRSIRISRMMYHKLSYIASSYVSGKFLYEIAL